VAAQLRPGDYEAMLERYRHPATPQDEIRYLYALAAFPDPELARRTFDLILDEVRTQNGPFVVTSLLANPVSGPSAWNQVVGHWDTLLARFPLNTQSRMVEGARQLCWPPEQARAVTDFLVAHPLRSGQRQVTQMLQRLAVALSFARRERAGLPALLGSVAGA
jgi:puromycin-sensitive aminopeptidase